ncbi:DUF6152 family protein [Deinococcus sp. YIM 134068]|uniref:DUF6152 family protein n=1 Tax=Deinococcus lichenicola TaxID=3118910 RepID=UPI002F928586
MPRHALAAALLLAATATATATVALAYHSYTALFDSSRSVTVSGTVQKLDYGNPHIEFDLVTANPARTWRIDLRPRPAQALALGLTEETLRAGTRLTVTGWPARDGTHTLAGQTVVLNGRTIDTS